MVVGAVVAVVVVFWPRFVFSSMTAWSQEILQLKIAVGAWWNPKTRGMQYAVAWDSGLSRKDSKRDGGDAERRRRGLMQRRKDADMEVDAKSRRGS